MQRGGRAGTVEYFPGCVTFHRSYSRYVMAGGNIGLKKANSGLTLVILGLVMTIPYGLLADR